MNAQTAIEAIVMIGGIFAGFFGLIKYILSKFEKINGKFFEYIEKKNGHLERISDRFSSTVEKNHDVIQDLSVKVDRMNENDGAIMLALKNSAVALDRTSGILDRAVKVIELQEKKEIMKEININNKREDALAANN